MLKVVLVAVAVAGFASSAAAQQQACTPAEAGRIDALIDRNSARTMRFLETLDVAIMQSIQLDSQALMDSLSPSCRAFMIRLDAAMREQPRPTRPPRLAGAG